MEQFARQAVKAGAGNCSLAGVKTLSSAVAAVGAGFRYIGGSVIGSAEPSVSEVRSLTLRDLYSRNLDSRDAASPEEEQVDLRHTA